MFFEEKLDLILRKIDEQQEILELFIPDLRKKKNVASFLGITEQCLKNWLTDSSSPIESGVHYRKNGRGEIEFVPPLIISLKRAGGYKNRRESKKEIFTEDVVPANNPHTQKILQKIGKLPPRVETPQGEVL